MAMIEVEPVRCGTRRLVRRPARRELTLGRPPPAQCFEHHRPFATRPRPSGDDRPANPLRGRATSVAAFTSSTATVRGAGRSRGLDGSRQSGLTADGTRTQRFQCRLLHGPALSSSGELSGADRRRRRRRERTQGTRPPYDDGNTLAAPISSRVQQTPPPPGTGQQGGWRVPPPVSPSSPPMIWGRAGSDPPFADPDPRVSEFNERLASAEPVPGGGSAAAVAAASLAAGARGDGRRAVEDDRSTWSTARSTAVAQATGRELAGSACSRSHDEETARAYGAFAAGVEAATGDGRRARGRDPATRAAARVASGVPAASASEACLEAVVAAESLAGRCNQNASSGPHRRLAAGEAARAAARRRTCSVNLPSAQRRRMGAARSNARWPSSSPDITADRRSIVPRACVAVRRTPRAPLRADCR